MDALLHHCIYGKLESALPPALGARMSTSKTLRRSEGAKAAKTIKYSSQQNQELIEDAILRYQAALATDNSSAIEAAYRDVCRLYPPLRFVRTWFQKYRYLYDSRDDFIQDYLYQFCKALARWQPRETRPESRFGGKGEFKNYFISTLAYNYSIRVKQGAAAKRAVQQGAAVVITGQVPYLRHLGEFGHPPL